MRAENKKQAQENARFFEVSEKDLLNFQPGKVSDNRIGEDEYQDRPHISRNL